MAPLAMILLLLLYLATAQSHRSGNFRGIFRNYVDHLGGKNPNLVQKCCTNALVNKAIYLIYMYTCTNTVGMGQGS